MDAPSSEVFQNPENKTVHLVGVIFGAGFVLAALYAVLLSEYALAPGAAILGLAILVVNDRSFRRARVEAGPGGLVVINPFGVSRIEWLHVRALRSDRFLEVETVDGRTIRAWGVQGRNIDIARGDDGYVGMVAQRLELLKGHYAGG